MMVLRLRLEIPVECFNLYFFCAIDIQGRVNVLSMVFSRNSGAYTASQSGRNTISSSRYRVKPG